LIVLSQSILKWLRKTKRKSEASALASIPSYVTQDRYWKGVIHLFQNNSKLKSVFTSKYFDLESGLIKIAALKKVAAPWSQSEKFMLNLALHLYNERNKVNLSDMDYLDDSNRKLAMEAITLRFFK
jgi:hypothetical protein